MIKVLFICHGNICRSPMSEYIMKDILNKHGASGDFVIESAATSREELGKDIYPPAKACLRAHGIPFEGRIARHMTESDFEEYDYIIAMENYNIVNLRRMFGDSSKYSLILDYTANPGDISDPWYSGDFETTYAEIERGCLGLFDKIK